MGFSLSCNMLFLFLSCTFLTVHSEEPQGAKDVEQPLDQHKAGLDAHADAEAVVLGREAQLAKGHWV